MFVKRCLDVSRSIGSGVGRNLFLTKEVWMGDRGFGSYSGDGCTIEENPLLMDGRFHDGMGFPARDRWSIVFIQFWTGVGCVIEGLV